jgi:uncharacterized FAD-dependent dehydrogenase
VEDGRISGVRAGGDVIETRWLVPAVGHSARDTFEMLYAAGLALTPKAFACGVRIEHLQRDIDVARYGSAADFKSLPAADYKLVYHAGDGRSAYTFCVCPGGDVIAAASEAGMLATNGMSAYARDGANCNGALLVNVTPADFGSPHPLAGIAFQRGLEAAAFRLGGGAYTAPAQRVDDFLAGRASAGFGGVSPTYLPGVRPADLQQCLPPFITETLRAAIPTFGGTVGGFDAPDAVLTAVESRSSSPVRIARGDDYQANIGGVFPCGEGAGYAGGIMSAAVDGVKCAEAILQEI